MRGRLAIVFLLWLLLISGCRPAPVNHSLTRRYAFADTPVELKLLFLRVWRLMPPTAFLVTSEHHLHLFPAAPAILRACWRLARRRSACAR
jgi:hypothetical protein